MSRDERYYGHWYTYKHKVIVWLEPTHRKDAWFVHMAVDPDFRKTGWPWKKVLREVADRAKYWSRDRGVLLVRAGSEEIEPYLPRLGFERIGELWGFRYG